MATEVSSSPASATNCASLSIYDSLPLPAALADLCQVRTGEHALTETKALPLQHGNLCLLVCAEHFLSRRHDESG
ncbi:hypothetical protein [Xanthomonas arboricola]|uniref:hypothetical protein n=1 Tax=Xanthomonas arboricola TaxID=56448 RepID=UPI001378E9E2|nr:hypothetical protein [Xanthomonas arboricola]